MKFIDLNADIGEADTPEWIQAESDILASISSANIACGGHAGDRNTMQQTIKNALREGVSIGAHPAYPDKPNFGRQSLILGEDISVQALKHSLMEQIISLAEIAAEQDAEIAYVKPHGALYNDAVHDRAKAELIAEIIKSIDPKLPLLGGPKSEMQNAAKNTGLDFIAEGFIDRRYTDDGHLLSRSIQGAVLGDDETRIAQALDLATSQCVTTHSGSVLDVRTQSLCVHGDSPGAVQTAKKTREALEAKGFIIRSFVTKSNYNLEVSR
jgi:UPF0271 protein